MKRVWVEFIGSGYEVVKMLMVECSTPAEAFSKAEEWYRENGEFSYCQMDIKDGRFINW